MAGSGGIHWMDVTFRRWALWRPCVWLWRRLGYVPQWALRIRLCDPPAAPSQKDACDDR